jgi:glycosyltransferase involved in cell wall biosynthesis
VPTISVVIPCKDDAVMLTRCLDALALQTMTAFEVIVVDNGSVDNSREVARAAGAYVIEVDSGGIANATASGFDAARGHVLARLDADSVPPPDWLARIGRDLSRQSGQSAVTGTGDFYGTNRVLAWVGRDIYLGGYFHAVGAMLGHPPLFGSNFAIPRSMWLRLRESVHRNRVDLHDDLDISLQLLPDMNVIYDPRLRVGISARQLNSWPSVRRHIAWSFSTFALNRRRTSLRRRRRERRRWRHNHPAG